MKLICPSCGAIASAESWENDAEIREAMVLIARLPSPVHKCALQYSSLFRPGLRALSWKKVVRLLKDIETLVAPGYVTQQGKPDKSCPPSLWAQAMEQMLEQRYSLSLPMKSHNYLRKIAWELANTADYKTEKKQTTAAQRHTVRRGHGADPGVYDPEAIRAEYQRRMQEDGVQIGGLPDFKNVLKGME